MKLLSFSATKDTQQEEISRKIARIQEIEKLATEANARLARAESDFSDALARSKETWAIHIDEQQRVNNQLESETIALENRKKQALIPISMYKQEADKIMEEAKEIVARATAKELDVDYLHEKLEDKLTEVADRLNILSDGEKRLEVAKRGIQSQQEAVQIGTKQLSEQMLTFYNLQEKQEQDLNVRKKEVAMAEINFNAKLEKYQRDLDALKIWDRQLKDKEETLARAMKRLT